MIGQSLALRHSHYLFSLHFSITPFFFLFFYFSFQQVKRSNYDTEMAWKRREERVCAVVKCIIFLYFFICVWLRGKKDINCQNSFQGIAAFILKTIANNFSCSERISVAIEVRNSFLLIWERRCKRYTFFFSCF